MNYNLPEGAAGNPDAPYNQMDYPATEGYIDPNQFDMDAWEVICDTFHDGRQHIDEAMPYAMDLANKLRIPVVVSTYDDDYYFIEDVKVFPVRRVG